MVLYFFIHYLYNHDRLKNKQIVSVFKYKNVPVPKYRFQRLRYIIFKKMKIELQGEERWRFFWPKSQLKINHTVMNDSVVNLETRIHHIWENIKTSDKCWKIHWRLQIFRYSAKLNSVVFWSLSSHILGK